MVKKQTNLFKNWFDGLSKNIQDEVDKYIERVLAGNFTNVSSIRKGIHEIKINYQKGYRLYFIELKNKNTLLLLAGGDKKSQSKDIKLAVKLKELLMQGGVI